MTNRIRLRLILVSALFICLIGTSSGCALIQITGFFENDTLDAPSDSYILLEDESKWGYGDIAYIRGTITNTHDKWSIQNIKVWVKVHRYDNSEPLTYDISSFSIKLAPGKSVTYDDHLLVYSGYDLDINCEWEWISP